VKTGDFSFNLPEELIAQEPTRPRDASRLLSLSRTSGQLEDLTFAQLPTLLNPGDLLVVNDTRVIPARLLGRKPTGGQVEVLLLTRESPRDWEALVRASKRSRVGTRIVLDEDVELEVIRVLGDGRYSVHLHCTEDPDAAVERLGGIPLPPYIREGKMCEADREWYQTVYAHPEKRGSAAAPTAGLHFTDDIFGELDKKGVERVAVTLHVGLGTFLPVRVDEVTDHKMHSERYHVEAGVAEKINRALDEGRRVVAVGTTATRVLEHCGKSGRVVPGEGSTEIFIYPGFEFKVVGAMVTNFHLPESTLLMLISAFCGKEAVLNAYRHAVKERYRFYSYGDAMFIG
jgi:S-adenosylmethionine:tRNA ribosyltransferase-isomerase